MPTYLFTVNAHHFFDVFAPSNFLIENMREEFFL